MLHQQLGENNLEISLKKVNRPFAINGHMVQNPSRGNTSLLLFPYWEIQNNETSSLTGQSCFVSEAVTFFFPPVWGILYYVIGCCKWPIYDYKGIQLHSNITNFEHAQYRTPRILFHM